MKKNRILFLVPLIFYSIYGCGGGGTGEGDAAKNPAKDKAIQQYNIGVQKEQTKNRFPCDTIALKEYILQNYEAGTYLVDFDRTYTFNIPKSAVIYYRDGANQYIFAVIAKSKPGERHIETKNIVGFESSYINLDSTKLGTAFFYLTLFECIDGEIHRIWESEVPIHGGFNSMSIKTWTPQNIKYVQLNYEDGIISGHRNYNFFLVDGIRKPPHLLETYVGIVHKRTMADINHDKYPDYYEYIFSSKGYLPDSLTAIRVVDSIPFYWSTKRQLYITNRNPRWFRKY
ncbi:hypothetical protein ABRY23_07890 [Melioribacteraceae bacterium 4301-Me]|uniref:hypothetical protein n=1 Tax=Pyranulibacter aquaticus TaxID=3163344 RepID=UPI00359BC043